MLTQAPLTYGKIEITFECEKCGKENKASQLLESVISNQAGNARGDGIFNQHWTESRDHLQKEKEEIFSTYKGLKHYICSSCGYSQSWMQANIDVHRKESNITFFSVITTALIIPVVYIGYFGLAFQYGYNNPFFEAFSDPKNSNVLLCGNLIGVVLLYFGVREVFSKLVKKYSNNMPVAPKYPSKKPVLSWELIDKLGDLKHY